MTVGVIYNPMAGTRPLPRSFETRAREILSRIRPGAELDMRATQYAGHASELAEEMARSGYHAVFAAGGDGTMNETARGLLGSSSALGILPLGSGNGLARHLGLPQSPIQAWETLLPAPARPIDSALANEHPFFLAAGIGFEGIVARRFAEQKTRGFFQYLNSSARAFFQYRPVTCRAAADGRAQEARFFTSVFANGSQYGNNARISPGSRLDDGLLQWVQVLPFPMTAAPGLFIRLMTGRLPGSPWWKTCSFRNLIIESDLPLPGHTDGEPRNFGTRLEVKVLPASLHLLIPGKA